MYQNFLRIINERGITPYRISKETGISQGTLSDWKHGRTKPKTDKLLKISRFLNVPLDDLVKEE